MGRLGFLGAVGGLEVLGVLLLWWVVAAAGVVLLEGVGGVVELAGEFVEVFEVGLVDELAHIEHYLNLMIMFKLEWLLTQSRWRISKI